MVQLRNAICCPTTPCSSEICALWFSDLIKLPLAHFPVQYEQEPRPTDPLGPGEVAVS